MYAGKVFSFDLTNVKINNDGKNGSNTTKYYSSKKNMVQCLSGNVLFLLRLLQSTNS